VRRAAWQHNLGICVDLGALHLHHGPGRLSKPSFSQGGISFAKAATRSSSQPDMTPFVAIPNLGLTRVLQTPLSSYEYCLHVEFLSHVARQSSTDVALPSSLSLRLSQSVRTPVICGITRSMKMSLWRISSVFCEEGVRSVHRQMEQNPKFWPTHIHSLFQPLLFVMPQAVDRSRGHMVKRRGRVAPDLLGLLWHTRAVWSRK
jgi:hypothetical protein